ncbi:ACP S-malonyltransferase [Halanaerobaculum tunisiense]
MSQVAFIFPGQGSQEVGMGQDLAEEFPIVKETFQEANQALDIDITELCWEGPAEKLKETKNTQPAILTTSIAVYRLLVDKGIKPEVVAGHSLGEYSALVAAGVLDFKEGLRLVRKRGELMSQAGAGTMAAVIGLEPQEVEAVCEAGSEVGIVEVANYNCPGQVVISGAEDAVAQTVELAKDRGAKKAVTLNVSGPFHSSLMESAGRQLARYLGEVDFTTPEVPVVTNVDATATTDPAAMKEALINQISGAVRWEESIRNLIAGEADTFIEVGPGRVLKSFMRRIDRSVTALNVGSTRSLKKTLKKL